MGPMKLVTISSQPCLSIWDLGSFQNCWSYKLNEPRCYLFDDFQPLLTFPLHSSIPQIDNARISTQMSPISSGKYRIWVRLGSGLPISELFKLSYDDGSLDPVLTLISTSPFSRKLDEHTMIHALPSFSGHRHLVREAPTASGTHAEPELLFFGPTSDPADDAFTKFPGAGKSLNAANHSGALTYVTVDSIVVNYYQ